MAMDDINGGGGGRYTPAWKREEEERAWAAAKEEERRQDRVREGESGGGGNVGGKAADLGKAKADKTGTVQAPETNSISWTPKSSESSGGGESIKSGLTYTPSEPEPEPEKPVYTPSEPEPGTTTETEPITPEAAESNDEKTKTRAETLSYTPEAAAVETDTERTARRSGELRSERQNPIVYTGGGLTASANRKTTTSEAAQTKNLITNADDDATILAKYWQMSPEEQAAQVNNPRVQAVLRGRAADQSRENRGNGYVPTAALRENQQGAAAPQQSGLHYLGAGPTEPGTMNFATATGPILPRTGGQQIRTGGYNRAEEQAPTGTLQPRVGSQQWLDDNGLSWAGQGNRNTQAAPVNLTPVSDDYPGGYDAMYEDMVRVQMGRGMSQEAAENYARQEITRQNLTAAAAQGASPRYIPATSAVKEQSGNEQPTGPRINAQEYQRAIEALNRQGIYGDEAGRQATEMVSAMQGTRDRINNWTRPTQPANTSIERMNQFAADEAAGRYQTVIPENSYQIPGTETYVYDPSITGMTAAERMRHQPGYSYVPATGGQGEGNQTPAGSGSATNRPGADAIVNSWDGGGQRVPDSVDFAQRAGQRMNEYLNRNAQTAESGQQSGGNSQTSKSNANTSTKMTDYVKEAMKKAQKLKGSYKANRGLDVIKLPYRQGGYTEADLISAGNSVALKDDNNDNVYEGYYKWGDKYYPIDMDKARYYKWNHDSYRNWDEGMREYWNNFGTFYGYRPDWKRAGGVNVWKQNRPAASRGGGGGGASASTTQRLRLSGYSGGGNSSVSYGRGSTANNGLYWNPNTSWSI